MQLQKLEIKELGESPLTRFLHLSSVAVIMIGPLSCVCFASASIREKELKRRLFVCEMACTDYMTGLGLDRVLEKAREAAELPDVKQVVLYQCCTDFLTNLDYESYLRKYVNRKDLRFYTYQRGSASLNYTEKKSVTERMQEDAQKDGFELLPVEKLSGKAEMQEDSDSGFCESMRSIKELSSPDLSLFAGKLYRSVFGSRGKRISLALYQPAGGYGAGYRMQPAVR